MERLTRRGVLGKAFFNGEKPDSRCEKNFCNVSPCEYNIRRTCPYLRIIDRLAEFEDMMDRWAFRDIHDIDTLCRRVNALGGTDRMAEYRKAEQEGRLVVKPAERTEINV